MTACRQPSLGESATKGVLSSEAHQCVQITFAIEGSWEQNRHMATQGYAADALQAVHLGNSQMFNVA